MLIAERRLRRVIHELIAEGLEDFLEKTADIEYIGDYGDVSDEDPTFERRPEDRVKARSVKRAWFEEADHDFMDSVVKIHWMKRASLAAVKKLLTASGKDEISAMGYIESPFTKSDWAGGSSWGDIGFRVEGWTSLAANNMDVIYTGSHTKGSALIKKYRSSGIPRRPSFYSKEYGSDYIFDESTFDRSKQGENEFVVDNWRITGVILSDDLVKQMETPATMYVNDATKWTQILKTVAEAGIPFVLDEQRDVAEKWMNSASKPRRSSIWV